MPKLNGENNEAMDLVFGNMGLDKDELSGVGSPSGDDERDDDTGGDDGGGEDNSHDDGGGQADGGGEDDGDLYERGRREEDDEEEHVVSHNNDDNELLPKAKMNRRGDIVGSNGQVLAKAGVQARLWRKAYKSQQGLRRAVADVQDVTGRLNEAIDLGLGLARQVEDLERQLAEGSGTGKELGLSSAEQVEALQMFALGKTNPVELLKKVLTRASVAGIDVKSLGLQSGVDVKHLTEQIRADLQRELGPVKTLADQQRAEREQNARREEVFNRTKNEVERFFRDTPEARPFMQIFDKLYKNPKFAGMPLAHAWSRMQLFMIRKGIMDQNGRLVRRDPQGQRSIPRGQRGDRRVSGGRPDFAADLEKDYGQILDEVMTANGYRGR